MSIVVPSEKFSFQCSEQYIFKKKIGVFPRIQLQSTHRKVFLALFSWHSFDCSTNLSHWRSSSLSHPMIITATSLKTLLWVWPTKSQGSLKRGLSSSDYNKLTLTQKQVTPNNCVLLKIAKMCTNVFVKITDKSNFLWDNRKYNMHFIKIMKV